MATEPGPLWWTLGSALVKLVILVLVILWAGSRIIPRVLVRVARLRSRELFTLTVLVFSIAVAAASYFFFGASMALGAFLAGMVVAQSPVANQAAADALPMRDAFAVLFFVSVGMLFNPAFLVEEPWMVASALVGILLVKPLAALFIVAVLGYSVRTALTVALGLAQIGEFSFILSDLAGRHGLLPDEGRHVLVASASCRSRSIRFSSDKIPSIESWLRAKPRLWSLLTAGASNGSRRWRPRRRRARRERSQCRAGDPWRSSSDMVRWDARSIACWRKARSLRGHRHEHGHGVRPAAERARTRSSATPRTSGSWRKPGRPGRAISS